MRNMKREVYFFSVSFPHVNWPGLTCHLSPDQPLIPPLNYVLYELAIDQDFHRWKMHQSSITQSATWKSLRQEYKSWNLAWTL